VKRAELRSSKRFAAPEAHVWPQHALHDLAAAGALQALAHALARVDERQLAALKRGRLPAAAADAEPQKEGRQCMGSAFIAAKRALAAEQTGCARSTPTTQEMSALQDPVSRHAGDQNNCS
jgi:hypothetical protein